ncbi:MAG: 50S ribosomal protein L16 [Caldivirga sp.]|jgi:large subunit ribosomal protein L10e
MPLRPARCYRRIERPYTRLEYIHGAPYVQIPRFEMGATKAKDRERFDSVAILRVLEDGQIRVNALEAARQMAYKYLSKVLTDQNFYLKIVKYPHHVIRENKMLAMAGADRLQEGMRLAFGVPTGRAVQIEAGDVLMIVEVEGKNIAHAKEALNRARSKLPLPCRIELARKSVIKG